VNLFVPNKLGSLTVYSHMIHILNQHDSGSTFANTSFALTVCWERPLWHKLYESKNRKLLHVRSAIL